MYYVYRDGKPVNDLAKTPLFGAKAVQRYNHFSNWQNFSRKKSKKSTFFRFFDIFDPETTKKRLFSADRPFLSPHPNGGEKTPPRDKNGATRHTVASTMPHSGQKNVARAAP
ncbi:MAG: hypothetical protein J6X70_00270 [Muribaculaceae bacterium]|nr:hypothetical protein [Muribaculaceae bacterium]